MKVNKQLCQTSHCSERYLLVLQLLYKYAIIKYQTHEAVSSERVPATRLKWILNL